MKKALLSILFSLLFSVTLVEPFLIYASGDSFDSTNYDLVDYVSPNGNDIYINTGYSPNANTEITGEFSYSSGTGFFYGAQALVSGTQTQYSFNKNSNGMAVRVIVGNTAKSFSGSISANTRFTVTQTKTISTVTDGTNTYQTSSYTQGSATLTSMFIFALNASGTPVTYCKNGKLYDLKIYESSVLVHHYYPCKRKSDNAVGIYDGCTNVFYTGTGGNLVYGSVVSSNYTITTSVSPSGSGTVSGGGTYASGTVVNLTATASSGYSFSQWSDGNTSNPRSVTVSSNETYTAVFEVVTIPPTQYTISTDVSLTGSGSVTGGGTYDEGTVVSLSAVANNGYVFANWSDNSTENPRSITVSQNATYTAIFTEESVDPDPDPDPDTPTPPSGWIDWTDSDDSEYLEDITSKVDLNKIYWSLYRKRVIDSINIFGVQMDVVSSVNGSGLNHVYFTGSYYDNTITALTGCNSSSYNYSTQSVTQTDVLTIEPAIYGQFDAPSVGEDGTMFNFGISVNAGASSNITATTNSFSNQTEACRLIGMGQGDGSVDGTTLLALGYQKKTITYNDGSTNGHTATVYVPGDEEFEFSADMSFLDDLLEGLYINIVNNGKAFYHDEYELSIHGQDGYLLPEYGSVSSKAFIGNMFNFNGSGFDLYQNINTKFNLDPNESTYAYFNNQFSTHITDNVYDRNYTYLYWQGTRNPKWRFKTQLDQYPIGLTNVGFGDLYVYNSYGSKIGIGDSLTISSSNVGESGLTLGTLLYVNIDSVKFYQFKNNSLLNRFNQLGSMMYGWFNRIYQAIGNITGGNESNEIINNVVEDYDIDVEVNFNGLLSDVFNKKQDIDLNDPEYVVPSVDHSAIHSLAEAMEKIYDEVYIQNGIGIVIFAPLILLVLRLIL